MTLSDMRRRLKPAWPALDVHVHPLGGMTANRPASAREDARQIRETARRAGVEKACLFSVHPTHAYEPTAVQCHEANDYVQAMWEAEPEFFLPFCYVSPMYPDEAVEEIDRRIRGERICGIKLWVARRASDPGLDPIMARARDLGVPVLQHAWDKTTGNLPGESFPSDVADAARRHPGVNIIMAHLNGCGLRGIEAVADCPNVFLDTSGGDPEGGMVEAAVSAVGPGRIVFGSDSPVRLFSQCLGKILGTNLPDRAKRDILWNNAAGLFPKWAEVKLVEGGGK